MESNYPKTRRYKKSSDSTEEIRHKCLDDALSFSQIKKHMHENNLYHQELYFHAFELQALQVGEKSHVTRLFIALFGLASD